MEELEYLLSTKSVYCHHSLTPSPKQSPLHLHNHFELFLFLEGDVQYFVENSFYILKHGDLLVFNSSELHGPKFLSSQLYERISIHVAPNVIKQLSTKNSQLQNCFIDRSSGKKNLIKLSENDLTKFIEVSDEICSLDKQEVFGKDVLIRSLVTQQLVTANQQFLESTSLPTLYSISPLIQTALSFIDDNLANNLSLEMLENFLKFDRYHLSKQFTKEIGSSIHQYIILKRISEAKKILLEGYSVSETCSKSGFNDYANFIRTFKKKTGYSPTNYLKQNN